jgi:hypothetical protein
MGITLKRGVTAALKFASPIHAATPIPMPKPSSAPTAPITAASAAKNPLISLSEAPSAFIMAKSRRRSSTQPVNVASTHSAAVRIMRIAEASNAARVFPSTRPSASMI